MVDSVRHRVGRKLLKADDATQLNRLADYSDNIRPCCDGVNSQLLQAGSGRLVVIGDASADEWQQEQNDELLHLS